MRYNGLHAQVFARRQLDIIGKLRFFNGYCTVNKIKIKEEKI